MRRPTRPPRARAGRLPPAARAGAATGTGTRICGSPWTSLAHARARRHESSTGYVARVTDPLLFVTQVAPYRDAPAGVHGVLDQAAVGVAQVAELHGLDPRRVDDVRTIDPAALRDARALALFTIGETPWRAEQRATIL